MRPPLIETGLFFTGGTTWKRIRNMMTPSFSGAKLKLMSPYITRCSSQLQDGLTHKAQAGALIDVKDVYGSFTMDVIAGTAFGLETNSQSEENEPFVNHCKGLFQNITARPGVMRVFHLLNAFPFLGKVLLKIGFSGFLGGEHPKFFTNAVSQMIDQRRDQTEKRNDLLQMLVDAEADSSDITDVRVHNDDTKSHKRMTKEEIIGQGFLVFLAGYETTSTTLQYLTFNLVHNPDCQEKVYHEIIDNIGEEDPTYENVSGLKYLEAALRETLRIFPPVPTIDRQALNAITLDGINLPAGCGVVIPIYAIMHDPTYFPEPEMFKPERFLKENRGDMDHILLELPFGSGPRQCIGIRLALLELKFAAVKICRKFKFVKCDETPEKITLGKSFGLSVPDVPIMVKAELR